MIADRYDVAVIGGGPAGLAAALSADEHGAKTLLIEREANLGGILKQCIHDGFGLVRYGEKLSGPEYAHRFIRQISNSGVETAVLTFVTKIEKQPLGFELTLVNRDGVIKTACKSIVLACGCRERTGRQIGIHGRHSAGVFTAGTAQYYTNILGKMPTKRCVILGSGDIGLIMARRLKLEGAEVLGVYEAKPTASGLMRNVYQCLEDFDIPLYTSKTVTRVFGEGRLNSVEVSSVDENMTPISGTEEIIECDALILSVGLIPENELAESLGVPLDTRTKGPITDQNCMTMIDGVFCCGNALHVNDLVDYVSESGETAGRAAAQRAHDVERSLAKLKADDSLLYIVPQWINVNDLAAPAVVYFRPRAEMGRTRLTVTLNGHEAYAKTYQRLRPPEMERLELDFKTMNVKRGSMVNFSLLEAAE
jgi:NADPH-dependent 2,4-dienoyl-CoA reductase/sulfur reductase-like enzyme